MLVESDLLVNRKANKEVLFVTQSIDDFVMTNLTEFNGRKIIAAEKAKLDLEVSEDDENIPKLSDEEQKEFFDWLGDILKQSVKEVNVRHFPILFETTQH